MEISPLPSAQVFIGHPDQRLEDRRREITASRPPASGLSRRGGGFRPHPGRNLGVFDRLRLKIDFADAEKRDLLAASDLFVSPVDNVQETFGLTPIEAMAAGLPSVVSDWDGYRDTVQHVEHGFRIPTLAPPAGQASGGT